MKQLQTFLSHKVKHSTGRINFEVKTTALTFINLTKIVMRKVSKMKKCMMCCSMISESSVQCRTRSEMH
jgi:hypothetical protein